jgi:subtilisin-like proprotein convertase family protein
MRPAPFADGSSPADPGRSGRRLPPAPSRRDGRPRPGTSARARARRLALEALERRELLAAMPVPVLIDSQNLSGSNLAGQHESAPVVAVSPINPNVIVSVWTATDPNLPAPTRTLVRGRISTDGGANWVAFNATPNVLLDPTNTTTPTAFSQVTDPTVGFDRNGNFYVLQLQSNANNAGAVVLNRFGPGAAFLGGTTVYNWNRAAAAGSKAVLKPVLAVDATTAYTDPTTGQQQTSPFQNRIYVAWAADTPTPSPDPGNWNPATVELLTSTDGGLTFGAPIVVNAGGNSGSQRNGSPAIAVSQGRAGFGGPAAGQVTIVWDDYGTDAGQTPARSIVRIARSTDGGASIAGRSSLASSDANRPVLGAATGGSIATPGSPVNLSAAPVIASDNTLGSFSEFQGRLYIAYTGRDSRLASNPADNTDIFFATSDDGVTWTAPRRANTDLAATDGFSETAYDGQGRTINGRPQWQPAAAVDPVTGTVLLSWFDARHDASEARVTTYLAVSSDGGADFTGQTYVNRSITPVDLVTRQAVNLGPIPDNQAAAGPGVNGTVGFGNRGGLAAFAGRAYVAWASNENGGTNGANPLDTRVARVGFAAGPRVLTGTSGPVGEVAPNDVDATDGSPILRGFDVTFDRRVAVADFGGSDVAVRWLSPDGATFTVLDPATFNVSALNATTINGVAFATRFRVAIPAQSAPGTYSYSVGPDIRDRVRASNGTFVSLGNAMDQDADGTNLNDGATDTQDPFAVPATTTGVPFATTVVRDSLPLIVPGPYVVATSVPGYAASSDNLALNGPVSALQITFDREMDPATFTVADVLRVMGPAGDITRPSRFGSTDVGRTIVDGGTTTSLLVVNNQVGDFTVADLDVRLDLVHPRLADLRVELVGPDGTVVRLVPVGTAGANFAGTVFDDEAPRTLGQGAAPYSSLFRPDQPLSAFDGKLLRGTWTLRVVDTVAGGGTGTIAGWSLVATPQAAFSVTPAGTPGPAGGFRSFDIGFPTQSLSGTYTVELGPNILSQVGGYAVDSNRNAGMDALRQVPTTTQSFVYPSPQAPLPIPANSTLVSNLTIDNSFLITDADLTLDITFANDPDLEAYLVLPDGTEVRLFRNVGTTGTRQNFTGTVFDDQAPTPIDIGGPPFSGRFRPQEPLDALNGRDAVGSYGLKIVNKSATLVGNLNSWSLALRRAVASTGLGEPIADRISANFRIFTSAATNSLASSTWTPIGPASIDNDTRAGRVGAVAVDPSDPSGNTVYIGGASGGVWKTTNFLTTDPDGPTWLPLTDFGPTFGLNVSAITIFPRNNDPNQSIIFAATGFPDSGTRGAGILRSTDGGATWTLLDSTNNNLPFAQRDKQFSAGNVQAYKMVVDPRPGPNGVIVYAALNNGLWRSLDTGQTWTQQLPGVATDITLDLFSGTVDAVSNPNGNLQIGYAAISGQGVFRTVNKGDSWSVLNGGVGKPFARDNDVGGAPAVPVANSPNPSALNRIALAKPALVPATDTDSQRRNLLTQGWLYAAGETGGAIVLYQTKDAGQNWTRVELNLNANSSGSLVIPTNDTGAPELAVGGANNLAIEVDPNDPNIVYIGLAGDPTLIRVDVAAVLDAHAFYLNPNLAGGATSSRTAAGGVAVKAGTAWDAARFFDPRTNPYVNLLRNPDGILGEPSPFSPAQGPFDNTGYYVNSISSIANSGAGAKWTQFEGGLQYLSLRSGFPAPTTGVHRMAMLRDPLTGRARLIVGDDHGLYTAVDNGRGGLLAAVGTASTPVGSRNGNLALAQFFYGAIQPSSVTTGGTTPAALLYGSTFQNGGLQSTGDILNTGNLGWAGAEANYSAGAVATDPQGSGAQFQYWFPGAGGNTTDFFQYAANGQSGLAIIGAGGAIGRTSGLLNPNDPAWGNTADLNFAVNPLTNQQIVLSSNSGRIYRTQNQGVTWFDIGPVVSGQPTSLDGSPARAIAYGAPDPAVTGSNIDDFIYAGTRNGNLWFTTNGGRSWTNLNRAGLDGSPIMAIATNPARGSHELYIATQNAVYHMPDSLAPGAAWRNVTGNLFGLTRAIFGDPNQTESILKPNALKALSVDWRYTLPDVRTNPDIYINPPANPTDGNTTSPLVYVGGEGGVFRTVDNGASWRPFPSAEPSSLSTTPTPPGDGGGLPVADVRDLDMSLGKIDPVTGRPVAVAGDPNMLVAWTFGRGAFGIRLAPIVLPELLALDPRSPDVPGIRDGGSDSGNDDGTAYPPGPPTFRDKVTNVVSPFIAGFSQQSAFGTTVNITLYDLADPANPVYVGGYNPADPAGSANFGLTDSAGRFVNRDPGTGTLIPGIQVRAGVPGSGIARLPDGLVRLGVQATDQAGVRGNMAVFEYTLDTTESAAPGPVDLQATSDAGWKNDDDLTNRNNTAGFPAPVFDVGSLATPVEPRATILLYRAPVVGGVAGAPVIVNRLANVTPSAGGVLAIADINTDFVVNAVTGLITPAPRGRIADGTYLYTVRQLDASGNLSAESAGLTVTIETVPPASPATDLTPDDDTGRPRSPDVLQRDQDNITFVRRPRFQGNVEPNGFVELFVGGAPAGTVRADATGYYALAATIDLAQGANAITIRQTDIAGNVGPISAPLNVTLDTVAPAGIAPDLDAGSDSGPSNTDNYTADTTPTFVGTAEPLALVQIFVQPAAGGASLLAGEAVANAAGAYAVTLGVYVLPMPTPPDGTYTSLSDGVYNVTIRQLDVAGNIGVTSAPLALTVDTVNPAPTIAPDLLATSDSPASGQPGFVLGVTDADNLTNVTNPSFTVGGVEPFAVVRLFRGGVEVAAVTVPAGGGPITITDPGPVPAAPPTNVWVYTANQTDRAGNVSGGSVGLTVTFDTTPPVTPGAPDLQATSDSPDPAHPGFRAGVTDADNITNVASPTFDVFNVEANATVQLLRNGTVVATLVNVGPGTVALTDTNAPAGTHAYTARQFDLSGNLASVTGSLSVLIDRTVPATPGAPDLQALSDSPLPAEPGYRAGVTNTDNLTYDNSPTFDVAVIESNATVELLRNGNVVATLVNVGPGTVAITDPSAPDGTHAYTVRQYDLAGNLSSTSNALAVVVDTTPPVVVVAPDLQASSDTPSSAHPGFRAGITDTDNVTFDNSPTFDVTPLEAGATLQLLRNGAVVATLVNIGPGVVAITDPTAPDGTHVYTARQYDLAGNLGSTSDGLTVVVDTAPPVAPPAPDLQALSDTALPGEPAFRPGITDTDNLTFDNSPTFDVANIEANATVQLLRNGVVVATLVNVGPGVVPITDPTAPDGTHVYTVRQYDLAGNLGATSAGLTVRIDTAPPVAPGTPDLQALSDSPLPGEPGYRAGITDTDNLTYDNSPTFDVASLEPNATLQLLRNGVVVATLVNIGPGVVAITDPSAPDGTHVYTARQYDLAGNLGATSAGLTVTIDTTPPVTPPAPDLQALSDTALPGTPSFRAGVTDADNLTFDTTPTFDAANLEAGATLQLLRNGVVVLTLVNVGPGVVAITDPAAPQGTHVYAVRQYDLAGNLGGTSAGLTVTIDTTPPVAPPAPDLQALSDTALPGGQGFRAGITDVDNLTFDNSPTFDVANIEANGTIELLRNGTVVATLVNVGPGVVPITDPAAPDGTHAYTVRQYDLAGNLGATSAALSVTIDTAPPVATVAPDLQALSDSPLPGQQGYRAGITDTDNVTWDLSPTFDIAATGVEPNAMVQLLRKLAGDPVGAYVVVAQGLVARSLTDNTVPASGGVFDYASRQVDLAGNVGPLSAPLRVVIDVSNPAPPVAPDLQASSDTGLRNDDDVTRITLFRFPVFDLTGVESTATAFLVRYDARDNRLLVNSRIGPGPLNDPVPLADGVYRYAVYQVDLAGNTGVESATLRVTIDTTSPVAPLAPDLLPSSDTGPSDSDNITSVPDPEFAIAGVEPGVTVNLLRNGLVVATRTDVVPVGGVVTIRDPGPVWAASHVYTAFLVDAAGNQSPIGGGLTVVVNSDVPAPPTSPDLVASSDSGRFDTDNVTNVLAPEFLVGGVEVTSRVELLRDGVVVATRTGPGTLRDDSAAALADGVYAYATRQVTQAGNTSAASAPLAVTIDRTVVAPARPDLVDSSDTGVSNTDDITSKLDPTFDIVGAEAGATVQLIRKGLRYSSTGAGVSIPTSGAAANSAIIVPAGAGLLRAAAVRVRLDIAVARASDLRATLIAPDGTRVALFANVGGAAGANFAGTILDDEAATPVAAGTAPFAGAYRPAQPLAAMAGKLLPGTWTLELRDTVPGGGTTDRLNGWTLDLDAAVERIGDGAVTDPGPLAAGAFEYTSRQVDLAGNVSPTSAPPLVVTIVTGTPAAPDAPDLRATSDTGPSDTDNVTAATAPVFDLAGAGVVGTNVLQLLRKPAGAPADQYAVVASRTGVGALADPGPVASGRYDYAARQVDAAGNLGLVGPALAVTIDTVAPAAPGTPDLRASSDTGNSSTDNITSDVNPVFDVIPAEPGATVQLLRDGVVVASRVGEGPLTDPGPLPAGAFDYTSRQVDLAGNASPTSGALRVTVDRNAPSAPSAPDLLAGSDTGDPADNITAAPSLSFLVSGVTAGNTVLLLRRAAGTNAAFAEVARGVVATGQASITLVNSPGDGRYEFLARHVAASGASTESATSTTVVVDRSIPAVPLLTLLPADDTGRKGDRRTVVRRPRLTGTTEPGATVELLDGKGSVVGLVVAPADGAFTVQPTAALPNGVHPLRARARDAAGNTSAIGVALTLTLTTAAGDYDGDGAADYAVYWPSNGRTLVGLSGGALNNLVGTARDIPLGGDFDGDGKVDSVVFQPAGANWRVLRSSDGTFLNQSFGNGAWTPLEGDYNGDGKADFAMFDPAAGKFYLGYNGGGAAVPSLGGPNSTPVAADFDGDGTTDVAVYEAAQGLFRYLPSAGGARRDVAFGAVGSVPVPADYDGDGRADIAVYAPASGQYQVLPSATGRAYAVTMTRNVAPLVGDFDGDGKADPGTYRKADGLWSILLSSTNSPRLQPFGGGEMVAIPVPLAYRRPATTGGPGRVLPPPAQAQAQGQAPLAPPAPAAVVPLGPLAAARRARRPSGR